MFILGSLELGTRLVNFLLVLIELFRYVLRRKSAFWKRVGQYAPIFTPIIFARMDRPMNALQLCADSFHKKTL